MTHAMPYRLAPNNAKAYRGDNQRFASASRRMYSSQLRRHLPPTVLCRASPQLCSMADVCSSQRVQHIAASSQQQWHAAARAVTL
jgi:hypothetical protein